MTGTTPAPLARRVLAVALDVLPVAGGLALAAASAVVAVRRAAPEERAWSASSALAAGVLAAAFAGAVLVLLVAQVVLHAARGVTIGRRVASVRTVRAATGAPPGLARVLARAGLVGAAVLVVPPAGLVVVLLSPLWDARGRSWIDRVTGTAAVDVRVGAELRASGLERPVWPAPVYAPAPPAPAPSTPAPPALAPSPAGAPPASAPPVPVPRPHEPLDPVEVETIDRRELPARDPAAAPAPAVPPPAVVLELDDGTRVPIVRGALLGRDPAPRAGETAERVAVPDPTRSVSKTHAELGIDGDGRPWIADRASTNGTAVIASGRELLLARGERRSLEDGDRVRIGRLGFVVRLVAAEPLPPAGPLPAAEPLPLAQPHVPASRPPAEAAEASGTLTEPVP